jgi:nucleoside-diphosphate-sugar epimerase
LTETIFLAGATGALGRRLTPLLVAEGWRVVGMTRSPAKIEVLKTLGAEPVVVDVFDSASVIRAVAEAAPMVVVHQLTDLPPLLDPAHMAEATARNARIRDEGTRNLVAAALSAGARRLVAQSIAFAYADSSTTRGEDDPLAVDAEGRAGVSARGVASLEHQVLTAPMAGLVLRYGRFYGPGTGLDEASRGRAPVHVDAAAWAALLAASKGTNGVYNIAEDDGAVSSEKAKQQLGWSAEWRAQEVSR